MSEPSIFVLCPENNRPSGGLKMLYRHADVLARNGFKAAVLHQQQGFRCTWFANTTPVVYLPDVRLTADDFLVIPEVFGPRTFSLSDIPAIGHACKKVIFNQNCYYTFLGQTFDSVMSPAFAMPYARPDEYVATIVVSDDSAAYMRFAFPGSRVIRIANSIDTRLFAFSDQKKPQICYMPRKHPEDALQVLGLLKSRGTLGGYSVVPIDNKSEADVARIMRESLMFLSFGYPEGFSLPPAEAMASGCIVIGYHGEAGREYFLDDFCYPVAVNDIVGFVAAIESVIENWKRDPLRVQDMARRAARHIHENYSAAREEETILAAWKELMSLRAGG
jgi:glycosyltransferase involved in cell wall biosynthesis